MKKSFYRIALSVMVPLIVGGCGSQDNEIMPSEGRLCTVQASFEDNMTRVSLTPDADSRDMITKWQEDDRIYVILANKADYLDLKTVPVHDISENGKSCVFQYALPDGFDASEGYGLSCYTNNCSPVIQDGDVFYNASIMRMPISQFKARVMFDQYVQEDNCFGSFHHYGTYELLHISNNSNKSINFALSGFDADKRWYLESGGIRLSDNKFVTNTNFERVVESPSVTIPAHSSDIIVSWYVPNGATIQNATLVAEIDGKYVHSSNTISSDVTLCTGMAYHMYAAWDGKELKFGKEVTTGAAIEVTPIELNFGVVMRGETKTENFTVKNIGQEDLTFTISQPQEAFSIEGAGIEQTLSSGQSKQFAVVCDGNKIAGKGTLVDVDITSNATNVESDLVLSLFAKNEGVCYNFSPEDGITLNSTSVYLSCIVSWPWNGMMVVNFTVSEKSDMSSARKVGNTSMGLPYGSSYGMGCAVDDLKANTKYYWQVSYFDFEEEDYVKCSPIMSFTTGAE